MVSYSDSDDGAAAVARLPARRAAGASSPLRRRGAWARYAKGGFGLNGLRWIVVGLGPAALVEGMA